MTRQTLSRETARRPAGSGYWRYWTTEAAALVELQEHGLRDPRLLQQQVDREVGGRGRGGGVRSRGAGAEGAERQQH